MVGQHRHLAKAPQPVPETTSSLAPFRHRAFLTLWSATLVSNFGGMVQAVGAAWLMTNLTSSATLIALVQASNTLPIMMFALFSGALADIFDRRRIMLGAQALMATASVLLAVAAFAGVMTPLMLLGFTFMIGAGQAIYNPPWQASMGDLVPRSDLPAAVTMNSVGFNMMRSVGPAAGGVIVSVFGAPMAFAINAASYVPLVGALLRWRPPARHPATTRMVPEPFGMAVGAGLRYVALSPNLLRVMSRAGLFGFAAISLMALLPLVAKAHPEGGSLLYGILLGCFGIGAIFGAFVNAHVRARYNNENVIRLAFGLFALSLVILALAGNMWVQGLSLLPAGVGWVMALSLFNVTVQLSTPRWVVARALSMYQVATFGGMAAGAWIWGEVASAHGVAAAHLAAAALLAFGAVVGHWFRAPEFGTVDLDPVNRFQQPELQLELSGRSGPIMVMVDYVIDQKDVPEFLRLMALRRNIRRRDGARGWALLRDLEQPNHWSESYHIATWDEYVRHNLRRTKSDAGVTEALRELHRGEGSPPVHRMIERHSVSPQDNTPLVGRIQVP